MNRHLNYVCYTDQQAKFTKGEIKLLECDPDNRSKKELESMQEGFGRPTTEAVAYKLDLYPDTMHQKLAFCRHGPILSCT